MCDTLIDAALRGRTVRVISDPETALSSDSQIWKLMREISLNKVAFLEIRISQKL